MMTVRLLRRSARTPATIDEQDQRKGEDDKGERQSGSARRFPAQGRAHMVAATCRMPSSATISFQALSLNAPQNCAISSARNG